MFTKARIKLTIWYLLIIMSISISFSAFIYRFVSLEFQRRLNVIERRFEYENMGMRLPRGPNPLFFEDMNIARQQVLILLIYANLTIFIFSSMAGYFLAGRTLQPIENTMEEQKRFFSDASHELKTPLTSLFTSFEVALRDKSLTLNDAKTVLESGLEETDELSKLVNNLLSHSKYQSLNNIKKTKFNIKHTINYVYKKMSIIADKKNIDIKITTKNIFISADRDAIEKLLTILLDNAIKYTPKNSIVKINASQKGNKLILSVVDSGIGIPKKDFPYIFERFYRVDMSRSKITSDGFGLGLALAKRITDLHKGTIKVKSKINSGSTFTVILPTG